MKHISVARIISMAGIGLLMSGCLRHKEGHLAVNQGHTSVSAQALPTVRLELGQDFETVQRHSTLRLLPTRAYLLDVDELGSDEPVVFTYSRSGCALTLPSALHLGCGFYDGHVITVAVSPHLNFLSEPEAFALVAQLYQLADKAGWKPSEERATIDKAKQVFANPQTEADYSLELRTWKCHEDELRLKMQRYHKRGESLPSGGAAEKDEYIVTLNLENETLFKHYNAENIRKKSLHPLPPGEARHIPVRVEPATH